MPSLEVGTVGGGTILGPQSACLKVGVAKYKYCYYLNANMWYMRNDINVMVYFNPGE